MSFYNTTKNLVTFTLAVMSVVIPATSLAGGTNTVTVTAYNSDAGQTDSTPCQGAHGRVCGRDWGVVAISRDLERHFPPHSKLCLSGGISGCFTVMDRMNPRWHRKVDIYVGKSRKEAFRVGHRKAIITNFGNSQKQAETSDLVYKKENRKVRQWLRHDYKSKRNVTRTKHFRKRR